MLDHEQDVGGDLLADSPDRPGDARTRRRAARPWRRPTTGRRQGQRRKPEQCRGRRPSRAGGPVHRRVGGRAAQSRPRHRTAAPTDSHRLPGTLADPLEIAKLTGLEFLELGPEDWRVLLDAGAVPRSLSAASIEIHGTRHPLPIVALANELLALWDRPLITRTTLEGTLGPMA